MSTTKDFENAPIGATATDADGNRAMKTDLGEWCWVFQNGNYLDDELMERRGYTLDRPAPTTVHDALDLVWELAHPVKEGQHIPDGTRLLDRLDSNDFSVYTTRVDFIINAGEALNIRTLEPLPEPEPDWLDAPAVMARLKSWTSDHDPQVFRRETESGAQWSLEAEMYRWDELVDVAPLYPKEQDEWCRAEHCTWRHWRSGSVPTHKRGADCPREEKGQDA